LWNIGRHRDNPTIALGRQFEEIAAKVRKLYNSASANDHVEVIEAMLGRLEPNERAIMATPARTVAGLGVKARHAAYVMSEYWDAPIDKIDWDARAVRLLIEAVCESAGLTLPFRGDDEKTPAADWPLLCEGSKPGRACARPGVDPDSDPGERRKSRAARGRA
jgi:hypothetical protein